MQAYAKPHRTNTQTYETIQSRTRAEQTVNINVQAYTRLHIDTNILDFLSLLLLLLLCCLLRIALFEKPVIWP